MLTKAREEADSQTALRVPAPGKTTDLGELNAVFVSKNSLLDSLALCFVALSIACGGAWIVSWLMDGMMHPKLIFCVCMMPIMFAYIVYRSVRIIADRQHVVIGHRGMYVAQGKTKTSIAWTAVRQITAAHIGDMIDEDAIEIKRRGSHSQVCFTRAQFPGLESLWARIVQAASSHVESGQIDVQSVDRSTR